MVGLEWYPCCRLKHNFSLQHGYHSNPTTPKLQHTSDIKLVFYSSTILQVVTYKEVGQAIQETWFD